MNLIEIIFLPLTPLFIQVHIEDLKAQMFAQLQSIYVVLKK